MWCLSWLWATLCDMKGDGKTLEPLVGCLKNLYAEKSWQGQWDLFLLVRKWEAVVGRELAMVTIPAYFRHDVLWVYVDNSAWMQHAQLAKPKLLEQVNAILSPRIISDLRWQLRPISGQEPLSVAAPKPKRKISPMREKAFREMVSTVEDKMCRKALLKLWQSYEQDDG